MENKSNIAGSGLAWLFDIDSLSQTMNCHSVIAENQSNPNAGFQDTEKAGEEGTQTYVLFPVLSDGSTNSQNNKENALVDGKEHDDDIQKSVSPDIHSSSSSAQTRKQGDKTENKDNGKSPVVTITGFRDLNVEFKECNNNSSNGVNAASSSVSTAGQNSINSTNDFSAAGPSNAVMPNLEDLSQDADDVGAEADINNLESIISVSPIPTTRIHKDHPNSQIIGDLSSTTQTRSMARAVRDQGGISQMFNEDFHTCMFACFLSQVEPKRVHQALSGDLTCLFTKATIVESILWHRRLGHINFKTLNKLVRGNLVRDHLGKFNGKANEGFLVGYSINRKAFKVFNSRNRKVKENMHVNFQENKPNVAGSGPEWLFDIDSLTKSTNYEPVSVGNQSNGDACIQKDIHSSDGDQPGDVNAGDQAGDVNACDQPGDVNAGDIQGDVEEISRNDDVCQGNKTRIDSSINVVNAASISINTVSSIIVAGSLNINTADSNQISIPTLEATGIFDGAFNNRDLGAEADINNLDTSIFVSPIPTARKQTVVATSSTEAEYVAAASGCAQVPWIQNQLLDYGDLPLLGVNTPRSDEDRLKLIELMVLLLQNGVCVHIGITAARLSSYCCQTNSDAAEGFEQVIDFLSGSYIHYALTVNPHIYISCIKQFWNTALVKRSGDVTRLKALVDKKEIVISEGVIREILQLDDAEGVNQVGDLSTHTTRFISPALTQKVFANMRRVRKGFSGVKTPLFEGMLVARQPAEEGLVDKQVQVDDAVVAVVAENVAEDDAEFPNQLQQVLNVFFALSKHVENLENDNATQKLEIVKLKAMVKKLEKVNKIKSSKLRRLRKVGASRTVESSADMEDVFNQRRMIDDMDKDEGIELEDDSEVQEVVEVVTTAKLITEVVTAAASQVSAASTTIPAASATIPAAKSSIPAAALTVVAAYTRRRKEVIIRDPEKELPLKTLAETPKVKDKGKGILVETPKPMKKKNQIEMDAEYARKLFDENMRFLFKSREEIEVEDQEIIKSINETPAQKAAKRRKLSEEAQEAKDLRKRLEVVEDEDDGVFVKATPLAQKVPVVDYQIVLVDNKPRSVQIIPGLLRSRNELEEILAMVEKSD
nr:ribonuclease H-like domain-containing protein [Tanacetum cinerariifolium]